MNYDSLGSLKEIVQHIITINIVLYVGIIIFSRLNLVFILALYNPFDPFFNFLQFISYMFIHSMNIFLHITFNMFILYIYGIHINSSIGYFKFIIIYFSSGIATGLLQNMLKILIIYHYTGYFSFYKISHGFIFLNTKNSRSLQDYMYLPIIGSSGAISSVVGFTFFTINYNKIIIINYILYYILFIIKYFMGISNMLHFSGAIIGYFIALCSIL